MSDLADAVVDRLAALRQPRTVETAVLDWLMAKNRSGRPPVVMAKLLTHIVALDQRGLPFHRRAAADMLSINRYTMESILRNAVDCGYIARVYLEPSADLSAVVIDAQPLLGRRP